MISFLRVIVSICSTVLFVTTSLVAQEKTVASGTVVTCKKGNEVRTIDKRDAESGGCEVIYTKNGQSSNVANAKNEMSYCDTAADKIKTKLVASGYDCQ